MSLLTPEGYPAQGHIPLDDPRVISALTHVLASLHAKTWIGGSAATQYPRAWNAGGDLDLWIADCTSDEYRELFALRQSPQAEDEVIDEDYATGSVIIHRGDRLHIMATRDTIQDTVDRFDISIHAGAVHVQSGQRYSSPLYTGHIVRINPNWSHADRSLLRGIKFALRYDDPGFWNDVVTRDIIESLTGYKLVDPHWHHKAQKMFVPRGL